jgi:hypothetical protein
MMTSADRTRANPHWQRLGWWALALGAALLLLTAAWLEPDSRGHGTHTQLGLPPCGFLLLTGAPCPGCGLTTAFAHCIRGNWAAAASANPLGLALFFSACACIPIGIVAGWRGWSLDDVIERFALNRWALALGVGAVALWVFRVASAL